LRAQANDGFATPRRGGKSVAQDEKADEHRKHVALVVGSIFASAPSRIEPATGGVSTTVYRILYGRETFYLRLLPDLRDSFASEVAVHARLRKLGVQVPTVVHYEHHNALLERSVMVTTAIRGAPVSESGTLGEAALRPIVEAAGRDLATINAVAVNGFGRLRGRVDSDELSAPMLTLRATLAGWDEALAALSGTLVSVGEARELARVYERAAGENEDDQPCLAHGDFSTRHIFRHDGCYTGIIDFGDCRGADGWYDLGYFHMRDGGRLPFRLEAALLAGYRSREPLPPDAGHRVRVASVLSAVPLLAESVRRQVWDRVAQHLADGLRRDLAAIVRDAA
jgi:aminoglycoside phosphotransferase (APT) family kinase protein